MIAIVGRESERCHSLLSRLKEYYPALDLLAIPMIQTESVPFEPPKTEATPLYLFTSPRAVDHFSNQATLPQNAIVASIGQATSKTLLMNGIQADITATTENAESFAPELTHFITQAAKPLHVIQPTSDIAGDTLERAIKAIDTPYTKLVTYKTVSHPRLSTVTNKAPQWILFYSPSSVRAWSEVASARPLAFSIGPSTTKELNKLGWRHVIESTSPHEEDILEMIVNNYNIRDY